ncbi:MAG: dihydrofolate reductase family protein [Mariprofundaceae bacterium]|nr:dihydrofolate reductase family protein [Mariprofundaceae bacterium]
MPKTESVLRLFPAPQEELPLKGLYLGLNLHRQAGNGDVLIYGNYIASLDGRIAVKNPDSGEFEVPETIANDRDWRLYQELAAQADIMLTSSRYFRQFEKGCAQDLLPVGMQDAYADLLDWRKSQGFSAQPAVAILSNSLDIPLSALSGLMERGVYVFTHEDAETSRVAVLEAEGVCVRAAGASEVQGKQLKTQLAGLGFRSAYMIAGPQVHHTLLAAGVLERIFLTTHYSLLGGSEFHTVLDGDLPAPVRGDLLSLYSDPAGGQSFAQFALR